ncbi:MAG TPA: hypothetical protein DCQ98_15830 [Planctomycetaceae bacterium]|nr:hypothetical protein [Planctomycetaceae bacterium]
MRITAGRRRPFGSERRGTWEQERVGAAETRNGSERVETSRFAAVRAWPRGALRERDERSGPGRSVRSR